MYHCTLPSLTFPELGFDFCGYRRVLCHGRSVEEREIKRRKTTGETPVKIAGDS